MTHNTLDLRSHSKPFTPKPTTLTTIISFVTCLTIFTHCAGDDDVHELAMNTEIREESGKFLYQGKEPVALLKQNGTLKIYKLVEVTYKDIEELFNQKQV